MVLEFNPSTEMASTMLTASSGEVAADLIYRSGGAVEGFRDPVHSAVSLTHS